MSEKRNPSGQWQDRRGSASSRGYGAAWRKLRARILTRDMGLCQPCLRAGRTTQADAVDHICNKASGGDDHPLNLQSICDPCHAAKTAREGNGGTDRPVIGPDGWPLE